MTALGLDTSNYTTSAALFDGTGGRNCSRLLPVKEGQLGLRQSEALFFHVKQLPDVIHQLLAEAGKQQIHAIGVSTRPRAVEGSYMPCFLAGQSQADVLGHLLGVPVYAFSHQQGHIAAALWSAGRMDLLEQPHLAWHLSGGTTELLLVEPDGTAVRATCIGGTSDISAGQLIDRTGQMLQCPFPAGKQLDALAEQSDCKDFFRVKHKQAVFSLSGVQNQAAQYFAATGDPAATARFVLRSIAKAVYGATNDALCAYPGLPVVFSGGVSSNTLLRRECRGLSPVFAQPAYSTDNAMGAAILAWRQEEQRGAADI